MSAEAGPGGTYGLTAPGTLLRRTAHTNRPARPVRDRLRPGTSSASFADQHTSSRDRLSAIARRLAAGKPIVTAQAVRSTDARASRVWSGDITGEHNDVWLVQVTVSRTIVCDECSHPPGAKAPTGRVATDIVRAVSFQVSAYGLGSHRTDLRRLGPVLTLQP